MNLTDYKRKKGHLPPQDYGTIFVFTSNRDGVSQITEHLVWSITKSGRRIHPKPEADIYRYELKEAPYFVDIKEDEEIGVDLHLFSGFGDCWSGSTFCSRNLEALGVARTEETKRILNKYGSQKNNLELLPTCFGRNSIKLENDDS